MPSAKLKRENVAPGGMAGLAERFKDAGSVIVGVVDRGAKYPDGTGVEEAALWNINGTGKIPKRDWISGFLAKHGRKYTKMSESLIKRVIPGRLARVSALSQIGRSAEGDMKNLIEAWDAPPNAPLTIAKKGFNDPLIHTRRLLKQIRWRIYDRSRDN